MSACVKIRAKDEGEEVCGCEYWLVGVCLDSSKSRGPHRGREFLYVRHDVCALCCSAVVIRPDGAWVRVRV